MTIAAGFVLRDAILLCADTQYTGGLRLYKTKLYPVNFDGEFKMAYAVSGPDSYATMAVELCQESVVELQDRSLKNITRAIRRVVKDVHQDHVVKSGDVFANRFQLLIAIWHSSGGLRLLETCESTVTRAEPAAYIGEGGYLARFITQPAFYSGMGLDEVTAIAGYALAAVKSYHESCGGSTEYVVIGPPHLPMLPKDRGKPLITEEYMKSFEELTRKLMLFSVNPSISRDEFTKAVSKFSQSLLDARDEWFEDAIQFSKLNKCSTGQT